MTQDTKRGGGVASTRNKDSSAAVDQQVGQRNKDKRERDIPSTKVVIRRLPPSMTMEIFVDQISPVPDNDYMYFVRADMSLGQHAFSRAYINFVNQEDIFVFKDKFDGYVFVDRKGNEYPAVVEFAPFQKIPKKKAKKKDTKCGTIEQDSDYIMFLENLNNPEEVSLPSAEFHLEEIENRDRGLRANNGVPLKTTPLIEYLKQRKAEKLRIREEKREERKRRELEKKRLKEDDRRRRKAEKDRDKERDKSKDPKVKEVRDKDGRLTEDKNRGNAPVKLLKNPDRENNKRVAKEGSDRDILGEETTNHLDQRTTDGQQQQSGSGGSVTSVSTFAGNRGDRSRRDGEQVRPARFATTGPPGAREREWEAERRRRQEEERQRKQREKRERTRFKRGRDEQQQPAPITSSGSTGASIKSNTKSGSRPVSAGGTDGYSHPVGESTSVASNTAVEDDRVRGKLAPRGELNSRSVTTSSNAKTDGATAPGTQQSYGSRGHERSRGGGGKSYEKSRESMAKARGGSGRRGGVGVGGNGLEGGTHSARESAEQMSDLRSSEATAEDSLGRQHDNEVDPQDNPENEDEEKGRVFETASSSGHQPRNRRERHGDPRTERRIRNKDRPSIELYRPGMSRRLSLQRNPKDSPSSSSSPSPTAQMLGRRTMEGEIEQNEHSNNRVLTTETGETAERHIQEQDDGDIEQTEAPEFNSNHET